MLKYLTAGESHGKGLVAIIEGLPANIPLSEHQINKQLTRRQQGYGRGERMQIEKDHVEIISGVRFGKTLGSPIALFIKNKDWEKWEKIMSIYKEDYTTERKIVVPRPGHADLAGGIKYNQEDLRNILERASARETAIRTAVGAVASAFLGLFGIEIFSHVIQIGPHRAAVEGLSYEELKAKAEISPIRCVVPEAEEKMLNAITQAKKNGDSLGGVFEVVALGAPVGLGSHISGESRLDSQIAKAIMAIPGIKGVEIGLGFNSAALLGSQVHDQILFDKKSGIYRSSNNAGGIEGGISNGEPIVVRGAMKPIPTLYKPLMSIDITTMEAKPSSIERSDICAVPAAAVVGEAAIAIELANAFLKKFGGDSLEEIEQNYHNYLLQSRREKR